MLTRERKGLTKPATTKAALESPENKKEEGRNKQEVRVIMWENQGNKGKRQSGGGQRG